MHEKDRSQGFPLKTSITVNSSQEINSVDSNGDLLFYALGTEGGLYGEVGAIHVSGCQVKQKRVMPGGVGGSGGFASGVADYVITPVSTLPSTINPGDRFNLTVEVTNEGSSGTKDVELMVNGEVVKSQIKGLLEGESENVRFNHRLTSTGSYEISVNGEVIGTINVQEEQTQEDQDGSMDQEDDSMEQDDGSMEGEDGSMEQEDDQQQDQQQDQDEQEEDGGGEGLPGFTPVIALIALVTLSVVYRRR